MVQPYKYIVEIWTSESDGFVANPMHQMLGLDT
ncbi:hypothetical protein C8J25_1207 [Sphingomonas faeni]|uniref:Uncharacterized protein n=1 Tax=Sphingomonas faeni TaxID=185950 RepID=A0A2T5TW84_9SPHN|nr:hypothetical protein C8J25_1207 [Sphingomonas faeni]